ncbi:hypothetical protein [Lysobacter hankyongensis]|uniref:Sulfotransferase family protein n=1 Tax=Lysobacter hankyongensis TaxID=1176535 RepID=A0ABP9C2R0_9GAMM
MNAMPDDSAAGSTTPSLFVVALPRSLSTAIFERARSALSLAAPVWTSAGEILNSGRWRMLAREDDGDRFTTAHEVARFEHWTRFLDDVVQPHGRAYKDVVQPFVCARWLAQAQMRGHAPRVLRVRRPLADVAWSMLEAGWRYPARAAATGEHDIDRLLSGLLQARDALSEPAAVEIDFDALMRGEDALASALQTLYPGIDLPDLRIGDAGFRAHSATVLARRGTPRWRMLDARLRTLEADVGTTRATEHCLA